ncbi:hypothetical protein V8V91_09225 [Algoriphagus halophilus]|uniref:DUF7133 domain-containing protein n=1 Tax=Algoriphagus halophilus TaxID=226505 RepID=UPI00359001E5
MANLPKNSTLEVRLDLILSDAHIPIQNEKTYLFYFTSSKCYFSCSKSQKSELSDAQYAQLSEEEKRTSKHALDGIVVEDDRLELTLFASEPMMINPTNMDVDDRGRVWITEAYNYRSHLNPRNPTKEEGDRILILTDTNGDGVADESKVFYQGNDINAALGIAVLGEKVYVSVSPYVYVFTDADGDDVPEKKKFCLKELVEFNMIMECMLSPLDLMANFISTTGMKVKVSIMQMAPPFWIL